MDLDLTKLLRDEEEEAPESQPRNDPEDHTTAKKKKKKNKKKNKNKNAGEDDDPEHLFNRNLNLDEFQGKDDNKGYMSYR